MKYVFCFRKSNSHSPATFTSTAIIIRNYKLCKLHLSKYTLDLRFFYVQLNGSGNIV